MTFKVADVPHEQVVPDRKTFWFWGLAPTREVDARAICPHGVSAIREETTFGDGFFGFITLGIYSPRTSYYHCRPAANVGAPT
jgi:hypothetical protein